MGFSKCLYAATRCIVSSGLQQVDFNTAAALTKTPIDVLTLAARVSGTRVQLHGVALDLQDLDKRMSELCMGFPIRVCFNGAWLELPFALANLPIEACETGNIGTVSLAGTRDGCHTHHTLVFLQGFCVLNTGYGRVCHMNVVHLDPRQFMARLPDRDKLIDEGSQRQRIESELKACWRRTLVAAKAQLDPKQFVETFYEAMRSWGHLDLLNDLDILPMALCQIVSDYPFLTDNQEDYLEPATVPTRQEIEQGTVSLVALEWPSEDNMTRWMLARAKHFIVFDKSGLD